MPITSTAPSCSSYSASLQSNSSLSSSSSSGVSSARAENSTELSPHAATDPSGKVGRSNFMKRFFGGDRPVVKSPTTGDVLSQKIKNTITNNQDTFDRLTLQDDNLSFDFTAPPPEDERWKIFRVDAREIRSYDQEKFKELHEAKRLLDLLNLAPGAEDVYVNNCKPAAFGKSDIRNFSTLYYAVMRFSEHVGDHETAKKMHEFARSYAQCIADHGMRKDLASFHPDQGHGPYYNRVRTLENKVLKLVDNQVGRNRSAYAISFVLNEIPEFICYKLEQKLGHPLRKETADKILKKFARASWIEMTASAKEHDLDCQFLGMKTVQYTKLVVYFTTLPRLFPSDIN
ncbi:MULTISPECIES: hypothetical protein [unclassified Undibacterium]|uniref:hypothetical protein n=1 Tax=unclassified Undibacterium TaxID=2630295 RepID=UPI002AC8B537|nr:MULTISPECIES: hypothetical protein [unclassified Undibacterium]MEB0140378.1 hypothetical protein [Undibacterium sp. CCC2.1]MEB0173412.1 hypothetical protein [Undibacterium sp. CCC1.1]MEB0177312.1 hypothetical protein [Undibacterium sp. CCC3.4]MEB0216569.1 hypothetical protein [Undibacterium sp. 5I2]WPX43471.1 hypothetical protein RHM61_19200 [Undibacterium sp. CCC3.4]